MEYLDEVIAMGRRYRRNGMSWRSHLEHTRRFILSAAKKCQNHRKAVILGSGLLLDVPLDELSSTFLEVVLLDIVFLPEIRRTVKKYGNVKLIQHDVTNMARKLHENIHQGRHDLPEAMPMVPGIDENTGLVVSVNILSQLWVVPRAYVLKKLPGLDEELVDVWCRRTVESHYTYLLSIPCTVSLITDHEYAKRDQEGRIVNCGSTISGLALPQPDASWKWDIVPMSDGRQYLSKELNVGAWNLR